MSLGLSLRVAVVGLGAVGVRCARQLSSSPEVASVIVGDPNPEHVRRVAESVESVIVTDWDDRSDVGDADVVVLAGPAGTHVTEAAFHLRAGRSVVSVSDDVADVEGLLALDTEAREHNLCVAVGAGFSPGLSDLLAVHAAGWFDAVDEVHVAKMGTGGPSCARVHHRALRNESCDWRDGAWVRRAGGSGRELVWFPDPMGGRDCYRAALPDATLVAPAVAGVQRVTARMAATRRDRLTAALPMLRPPHQDGGPGAIRVEVRGVVGDASSVAVVGAMDRPAVAAGAVAALTAVAVGTGSARRHGAGGLGELFQPLPLLEQLAVRGVRCARFDPAEIPAFDGLSDSNQNSQDRR